MAAASSRTGAATSAKHRSHGQIYDALPLKKHTRGRGFAQPQERQSAQVEKIGLREVQLVRLRNQAYIDSLLPASTHEVEKLRPRRFLQGKNQFIDMLTAKQVYHLEREQCLAFAAGKS